MQRQLARVFQAVVHADRDIGRFVLGQQAHLVAAGHARGARHHDPVFGAVVVHLQRQLLARLDRDALDLEAVARIDALVVAPWAVHAGVVQVLGTRLRLQVVDHLLDALHLVLVGDQHSVLGLDHDDVFHADHRHDARFGAHQRVLHAVEVDVAALGIAVGVLGLDFPQRRPGTDVVPADVGRHHGGVAGLFHHRVVDRVGRAVRERLFFQAAEVEVAVAGADGLLGCRGDGRRMLLQLVEEALGLEHEHAAVPVVAALVQEGLGRAGIRLLDEARHRIAVAAVGDLLAAADVAVAGFRRLRHDAEGGQLALPHQGHGALDGVAEGGAVFDHVVGRQHQHQRFRIDALEVVGGGRHRRSGVAADRLEQDAERRDANLAQLLGHHETVVVTADHQGRHHSRPAGHALRGLLQHGLVGDQRQELLGQYRTRQRPQAGAGAAGEDDWINFHALTFSEIFSNSVPA